MFKKTAIFAGLSLALAGTAHADEYHWGLGAGISGGDDNALGLDGRYFLGGVDDSKGPYGEAEFIDHASFIGVSARDGETDGEGPGNDDLETESYAIFGRYVTDDAGWIFEAGYDYAELDFPNFDNVEVDTFGVGFGKYITDTTTLVLSYENVDADDAGEADTYRIDVDHLFNWGDSGVKLHGAYGQTDRDEGDDIDVYEIDATWYIWKNFGIGALYANADDNGFEKEEYGAFAEYFISDRVAVALSYVEGEIDDTDIETDSYRLGVTVRL